MNLKQVLKLIKSKKLSKIKNLKHGFFNSMGGHSKDIYKSLNCGPGSNDKQSNIKKNLQKVRKKISTKAKNIFLVSQFHSNKFVYIDEKYTKKRKPKADAIITNQKNLPIAVLTADCAPILIYDNKIIDTWTDKKWPLDMLSEVEWLVKEQAKINVILKKDDLILTGAYGFPVPINNNTLIKVSSSEFGDVEAKFK